MQNFNTHPEIIPESSMFWGKAVDEIACHPVLAAYFRRIEEVVLPGICRLLNFFRSNGLRVVFLTKGCELAEGNDWRVPSQVGRGPHRGSFGAAVCPEVAPKEDELVVHRPTSDVFNSSALAHTLRFWDTDTLFFAGVGTSACVEGSARHAADIGYKCVLIEDCCAIFHPEDHYSTLRIFARYFGMVSTSAGIIALLGER